jgi:hypothetical protein
MHKFSFIKVEKKWTKITQNTQRIIKWKKITQNTSKAKKPKFTLKSILTKKDLLKMTQKKKNRSKIGPKRKKSPKKGTQNCDV